MVKIWLRYTYQKGKKHMIQPEQVSDEKITQLQIVLDNLKAEE